LKNETFKETIAIKKQTRRSQAHMKRMLRKFAWPGAPVQYFIFEGGRNP
jgi:hypothetical protein